MLNGIMTHYTHHNPNHQPQQFQQQQQQQQHNDRRLRQAQYFGNCKFHPPHICVVVCQKITPFSFAGGYSEDSDYTSDLNYPVGQNANSSASQYRNLQTPSLETSRENSYETDIDPRPIVSNTGHYDMVRKTAIHEKII